MYIETGFQKSTPLTFFTQHFHIASPNKMKIALVNPATRNTSGYHSINTKIPPLGLQVLAKLTPAEHQVEIIDEIFNTNDTEELLLSRGYDFVGITSYTSSAPRAYELAVFCRQHNLPAMMGGPHASACPDEASQYFSTVAVGECDAIWHDIIADAQAGCLKPRYEGYLIELTNGLGTADQSMQAINGKYDVACIQTARGCPIGCKFCSVTRFNGKQIRRRPVDDIIAEWNTIKKPFVFIVDDNFYGVGEKHAQGAREVLQAIIKRGKKHHWFSQTSFNMGSKPDDLRLAYKAGCRAMLVGIESFNEENLKSWGKALNRSILHDYQKHADGFHKAGVAILGGFVIGTDNDTVDTAADTLLQAVRMGVDIIQVTNMTPLPGTELYDEMLRENRLIAINYPNDWERYTFIETVFNPKKMTARQLDETMYEIRTLAQNQGWAWKRSLRSLFRTHSFTTALFVLGMNLAWVRLAKSLCRFGREKFEGYQIPPQRLKTLKKCFSFTSR